MYISAALAQRVPSTTDSSPPPVVGRPVSACAAGEALARCVRLPRSKAGV
jgi:hypothetical protein